MATGFEATKKCVLCSTKYILNYLESIEPQYNQFDGRCVGRRGSTEWPPRYQDLTFLDFLWEHLKSRVYMNTPDNLDVLKTRIRHEMSLIIPQGIENSVNQVCHRLGLR